MGVQKIRGSPDIAHNIAKMGVFCSFSEGSIGPVLQKLVQIEFPINFTKCQSNYIIFVKEQ